MSKTITVYTPAELKELDYRAFERAWDKFRYSDTEIPWSEEIIDSLKAIFKHTSGIVLRDWEIDGNYPSSSRVKFEFDNDDVGDLRGQRALAWLENNLLSDLRYKPGILHIKERVWMSEYVINLNRKNGAFIHLAGELKSCPFTGYCADDDFIESLIKSVKAGDTLGEAFHNLAYEAGKMFESEIEYVNSEEYFLEQGHLELTEDGDIV